MVGGSGNYCQVEVYDGQTKQEENSEGSPPKKLSRKKSGLVLMIFWLCEFRFVDVELFKSIVSRVNLQLRCGKYSSSTAVF